MPDTSKRTMPEIVFQVEADISLLTGRTYTYSKDDSTYTISMSPKQEAENFIKTYVMYRDLIYDDKQSFGFYCGGPNEQDYPNRLNENGNIHTIINHPSYGSDTVKWKDTFIKYDDSSDSYSAYPIMSIYDQNDLQPYSKFWESLLSCELYNNPDLIYEYSGNGLIYAVLKGILFNDWTESIGESNIRTYLDMDNNLSQYTLPEDFPRKEEE